MKFFNFVPRALRTVCCLFLQDDEYRGFGTTGEPYFYCGRKNAVWVSMDMVVYSPPTTGQHVPHRNTSNGKSSAGAKHPGQNTGKHEGQQMPSDDSTGNNSTVQNATTESNKSSRQGGIIGNVASKVWNFFGKDQPQYPTSKLYKEGDRVVIYSMKAGQFIGATVRWTGQVQLSKESAMPLAMVVGLETVSCMFVWYIHVCVCMLMDITACLPVFNF